MLIVDDKDADGDNETEKAHLASNLPWLRGVSFLQSAKAKIPFPTILILGDGDARKL